MQWALNFRDPFNLLKPISFLPSTRLYDVGNVAVNVRLQTPVTVEHLRRKF